jgi:MFS transporter, DHA1 family, multidrug resistance protein
VLDAAGYGMLAPVLPEIGERSGTGPAVAGAIVACFAFAQLVGYPLFGVLAARRGATPVLVGSLLLLLAGDAGFVFGDGLAAWFPSRGIQGLGAAGLWIGVTFAVLEHWPATAYQRLTGVLAAYAVGSILGPAFGAIEGVRGPFVLHGVVTAAVFLPLLALCARRMRARGSEPTAPSCARARSPSRRRASSSSRSQSGRSTGRCRSTSRRSSPRRRSPRSTS